MIAFLNGVVAGKNQSTAFVDVGGVGFAVGMSANDLSRLPSTTASSFRARRMVACTWAKK